MLIPGFVPFRLCQKANVVVSEVTAWGSTELATNATLYRRCDLTSQPVKMSESEIVRNSNTLVPH